MTVMNHHDRSFVKSNLARVARGEDELRAWRWGWFCMSWFVTRSFAPQTDTPANKIILVEVIVWDRYLPSDSASKPSLHLEHAHTYAQDEAWGRLAFEPFNNDLPLGFDLHSWRTCFCFCFFEEDVRFEREGRFRTFSLIWSSFPPFFLCASVVSMAQMGLLWIMFRHQENEDVCEMEVVPVYRLEKHNGPVWRKRNITSYKMYWETWNNHVWKVWEIATSLMKFHILMVVPPIEMMWITSCQVLRWSGSQAYKVEYNKRKMW